jgi:hypothetical protein
VKTFTFELNFSGAVLDYVIINRLTLEITAEVLENSYGEERDIDVVAKWWFVDFPSYPLPTYKPRPLTSFEVVIIILSVIAGLIIIAFIGSLIYDCYIEYRENKEELEKNKEDRELKLKLRV